MFGQGFDVYSLGIKITKFVLIMYLVHFNLPPSVSIAIPHNGGYYKARCTPG